MAGRLSRLGARLRGVALWRWALLWVLGWAWALATAGVMGDHIATRVGPLAWLPLDVVLLPPVWLGTGALYAAACLAFTFGWRERLTGSALFIWLGVMGLLEMGVRSDTMPPLANMLSANLVAAWLIGSGLPGTAAQRATRGREVMCGVFGAMLTLAGLAKLRHAGWDWFDGHTHALFIWERAQPLVAPQRMADLRLALAQHPTLAALGATYAVVVECAGFLFAIERLRKPYAVAVLLMFLSLNVVLGLGEQGWVAVPMALAWARRPGAAA
jgi:hypothetical protein